MLSYAFTVVFILLIVIICLADKVPVYHLVPRRAANNAQSTGASVYQGMSESLSYEDTLESFAPD